MEVEHFRVKDFHPDLVVQWCNLLPSCKRCNVRKSTHNVDVDGMIIDPTLQTPCNHLFMKNYRLHARDGLGRTTIETVQLNDLPMVVRNRFNVGQAVDEALEKLRALLDDYLDGNRTRRLENRVVHGLNAVLLEAKPPTEYCATAATVIMENPDFRRLRIEFQRLGWWTPELESNAAIVQEQALCE